MIELQIPTLILQHPQEPTRKDNAVSSVPLLTQQICPLHVATGLSWRNLEQALTQFKGLPDATEYRSPANWATLYLGTQTHAGAEGKPGIYFLDKKGALTEPPETPLLGLILLDGTWSQAKTLWWRNAWLLKTKRIFLVPKEKSKYGKIRKEPRPECVSTLEAAAECYTHFGFDPNIEKQLKTAFEIYLN